MPATRMHLSVLDATCGAKIIDDTAPSLTQQLQRLTMLMQIPAVGRAALLLSEIGELGPEGRSAFTVLMGALCATEPRPICLCGAGRA